MENSTERIEDLISGRLTESEASELQAQISSDSSLKEEFDFQERVISEISAVRQQELKARLGALAVTTGGISLMKKYLIAAGVAGVTFVSAYIITDSDTKTEEIAVVEENDKASVAAEKISTEIEAESDVLQVSINDEDIDLVEEKVVEPEITQKENISEPVEQNNVDQTVPQISIPGPVQGNDQDILMSPDNDEGQGIEVAVVDGSNNEVKVFPSAKKNRFHYKYEGSSVWVQIAGYSEAKPALLINYPEKNELFLSYDQDFYELSKSSTWQSLSVQKISNAKLIQQLKNKIK